MRGQAIVKVLNRFPSTFSYAIETRVQHTLECLKSLGLDSQSALSTTVYKQPAIFSQDPAKLTRAADWLVDTGVPREMIPKIVTRFPAALCHSEVGGTVGCGSPFIIIMYHHHHRMSSSCMLSNPLGGFTMYCVVGWGGAGIQGAGYRVCCVVWSTPGRGCREVRWRHGMLLHLALPRID